MSSSSQQYDKRGKRGGNGGKTYANKQNQGRNINHRSGTSNQPSSERTEYSGNVRRGPHNRSLNKSSIGGGGQHYKNVNEHAGDSNQDTNLSFNRSKQDRIDKNYGQNNSPKSESAFSGSNLTTSESDTNIKKSWDDAQPMPTATMTLNPQAKAFNPACLVIQEEYCGVQYPDTSGHTGGCQLDDSISNSDYSQNTYKGTREEQDTIQERNWEQLHEYAMNDSVADTIASIQNSTLDSSETDISFEAWNNTVSPNTSGKLQGLKYKSTPHMQYMHTNENFSRKATTYESFENKYSSTKGRIDCKIVNEVEADLFEMDESYALANCVASDFNMGSGIAVRFRQEFKNVDELLAQRQTVGGLGVLKHGERYVYYLVTKRKSSNKPTYESLFKSLEKLREHMIDNDVKKLAIPRLGCGLDRLEWNKVKVMLEEVFAATKIAITVCNFQKADESMNTSKDKLLSRKCPLQFETSPITRAQAYSIIVYLGSVVGHVDHTIKELDNKFGILKDYNKQPKKLGDLVVTNYQNYKYYIMGCVVKEKFADPVDFAVFGTCMKDINKENNKFRKTGDHYTMIAIDSYYDPVDELLITKLTNLMKNTLYDFTVCVHGSKR